MRTHQSLNLGKITPILAAVFLSLSSTALHAAGKERGGGVAFSCREGRLFGRSQRVYLADSYPLKGGPILKKLEATRFKDPQQGLRYALQLIGSVDPEVSVALEKAIGELREQREGHIPLLGDDKITVIPDGCEKVQVAVQEFDRGVLRINHALHHRMSPVDQMLLLLHEGFLRLLWRENPNPDVAEVREKVLLWARTESFAEFLFSAFPSKVVRWKTYSFSVAGELVADDASAPPQSHGWKSQPAEIRGFLHQGGSWVMSALRIEVRPSSTDPTLPGSAVLLSDGEWNVTNSDHQGRAISQGFLRLVKWIPEPKIEYATLLQSASLDGTILDGFAEGGFSLALETQCRWLDQEGEYACRVLPNSYINSFAAAGSSTSIRKAFFRTDQVIRLKAVE